MADSRPPGTVSPTETRRHRILLVDDEPEVLTIVGNLLALADYEVDQAADGPTALKNVTENRPDLVLLDLIMPGMSGEDVLRRLKFNPVTKEIPVIVLSALDESGVMGRCRKAGALDYLVKPVDTEVLLTAIDKALLGHERPERIQQIRRTLEEKNRAAPVLGLHAPSRNRDVDSLRQELAELIGSIQPVLKDFETRLSTTRYQHPQIEELDAVAIRIDELEALLASLGDWARRARDEF